MGNIIANRILGLTNEVEEIIPDAILAGLKEVFLKDKKIAQAVMDCVISIDIETVQKLAAAKNDEEFFREVKNLSLECLIPAAISFGGDRFAAVVAKNPQWYTKLFTFLSSKAKIGADEVGDILYKSLNLDVILKRNDFTKAIYKRVLSTANGTKAMDLLIKAQIDIANISGKNFERLSNIINKFGAGQDEALLRVLKDTRDYNNMFTYLDNMVANTDEYLSDLAKIEANEMFKKSVAINGKTTTIANFIDEAGGVYQYFYKTEGNIRYFVKLQDGTDGVVIVKELVENEWKLSVSTFGNWTKGKTKAWVDKIIKESEIKTNDEE